MIFRLQFDKNREEEIVATVHDRSALIDEIGRLVLQENLTDQIPGYIDESPERLALHLHSDPRQGEPDEPDAGSVREF